MILSNVIGKVYRLIEEVQTCQKKMKTPILLKVYRPAVTK